MPEETTPIRGKDFVKYRAILFGYEVMQSYRDRLSGFEAFQRGTEAYEDYIAAYDRRHRPAAEDVK